LAIPDETATEFATLIVRDLDPETEIIARAETGGAVPKTYRAGADYVLSLATVSGRSIASLVINDEEILGIETNVEIIKTTAPGLAGETLEGAQIRARTGCTVVAVERDDATLTDLDADFRIDADDRLVIAGSDSGVNTFLEEFCG
jgi:Trk K+ transport system NAD-binding subunit